MDWAFEVTIKNRALLERFIDNFSLEQLNKVPKGFDNNVIWNIAHVIITQQLLIYNLSGLPMLVSDEMVATYRKGTKVNRDETQNQVDKIKSLLYSPVEQTKLDYENEVFMNYKAYTVSTGSTLTNVDEAIAFNNFHEGIHLGYILALKKNI